MEHSERAALEQQILDIKKDILALCHRAGASGAHLGGCLSMAEIAGLLYLRHLRIDRSDPAAEENDRFVLSKGHGGIAQYAAMHAAGLLTDEEMRLPLTGPDTFLFKHPERNAQKGLLFSGGSLGQGLPFAVGVALALRYKGNSAARVYALVGDGELNEGSIWEGLAIAGHQKLSNFTLIVDCNGLQLDGKTVDIQHPGPLLDRFSSLGFTAVSVDGHDVSALDEAFLLRADGPVAILASTVKGRGVSFAENAVDWHSNVLTDELYEIAKRDLGVDA